MRTINGITSEFSILTASLNRSRERSFERGTLVNLFCTQARELSGWLILLTVMVAGVSEAAFAAGPSLYDFTLPSIDGQPTPLSEYKGKVVLLVNVASRCGFTPQYAALESLYEKYKDQGFVILGFPENNFGGQEPGTNQEIKTFFSTRYNVTFPMFAKISVKGADTAPLYQFLTQRANPEVIGDIKWNFTKFLISKDGQIVARFEPKVKPESKEMTEAIESELRK